MTIVDSTDLARITTLLRAGNLPAAESMCRELLVRSPGAAAAVHLLGLIRKDAGDLLEGERLLRRSIAIEPLQPEYKFNLANLLRRMKRSGEAVPLYREVLLAQPANGQARAGLIRALDDLGELAAAEAECRRLLAANERNPQGWSLLAMIQRNQGRLGEAERAYRRAIDLAPTQAQAHHNLGSVLIRMDRAEEALQALEHAQACGLEGFELAFNRGMALLQLYRITEAENAFALAVAHNPLHAEAQINLARLRFMQGQPDFSRDIAAAAAAHGNNTQLQILLSLLLRRSGDLQRAESLLRDARARIGPSPEIRAALAEVLLEAGRLGEAEAEALEAAAVQPDNAGIVDNLVAILLSRGRPADALPFILRQRQRFPTGQNWLAYEATAARMLGDPRHQELYDYGRLVRTYDIEAPTGELSMQTLNAALLQALDTRHAFANHPLDQSLRHGSQTARNLIADPDPTIQAIMKIFELPIQDYLQHLGTEKNHPLSARNHGNAVIAAAWSVQLRREGFHVNHVHPQGWISSAYYVDVPEEAKDETLMSGWLKFGEPRYPVPGIGPEGVVQPRAGRLVLFPSYMWHGTNAIHGEQTRTTIAFDVVPGPHQAGPRQA